MRKYLIWVFAVLFALPTATAQTPHKQKTTLQDIIGKVWYPKQRKGDHGFFSFQIKDKQSISGYDGCNNFYVDYKYKPNKGFELFNEVATLLACPLQDESFGVSFLREACTFELKGDALTFYGSLGEDIITVYDHVVIDESPAPKHKNELSILTGKWVLRNANHPTFAEFQNKKVAFYMDINATGSSVSIYGTEGDESFNYFATLHEYEDAKVRIDDNPVYNIKKMEQRSPKAYTLFKDLLQEARYEFVGNKLLLQTNNYNYVFETQP